MEVIKKEKRLCSCCMEEHDVMIVREEEHTIFKNQPIDYYAVYEYCDRADEYQATEEMISDNDLAMKDAYRTSMKLLTTEQIVEIRRNYQISQNDLANLLGWGGKTLTRYESHQVQDVAHDTILRKIDDDPEWFLEILEDRKERFAEKLYLRYRDAALKLFEQNQDNYLRKSIVAKYVKYEGNKDYCGGKQLDLDKLIDVIRYYANSELVTSLYKVKMMKLLWYADCLSYKRWQKSITGLVYTSCPMGAVPVAHRLIMDLKGLNYDEVECGDTTGYRFKSDQTEEYRYLSSEDKRILDDVIAVCGKDTREQIVQRMHKERGYLETKPNEIIRYHYAADLSI